MIKSPLVLVVLITLTIGVGAYLTFATPTITTDESEDVVTVANITDAQVNDRPLLETPLLKDEVRTESNVNEKFNIKVTYPSVILATTPTLALEVSDVIKSFVEREITEFKKGHIEMSADLDAESKEFTSDLTANYKAELLTPNLIVIRFDVATYYRGQAHGISNTKVLRYDLVQHELLETSDLFAPGIDHLGLLSQLSRVKLRTLFTDMNNQDFDLSVIPGTEPTDDNFRQVFPSADGLHVVFDPYQVAPYARGTTELVLPKEEILKYLSTSTQAAINE